MDTKKQLALAAGASLGLVALYRWQRRSKKAAPPPLAKRRLAPGLEVTVLGCGGASLGDLYVETSHESALATLRTSLDGGIQFYDTAPWYGCGLSEARFGLGLARADRESFALNTKVGRTLEPDLGGGPRRGWKHGAHFSVTFDYSGAAFRTQLRDSLQRTGLARVESLVIHDLEPNAHKSADDPTGVATTKRHLDALASSGFAALCELRASGAIRAFGAGVNADEDGEDAAAKAAYNADYVNQLFALGEKAPGGRGLDFLLIANCYSLLNFSAAGILDECEKRGVAVVIGGPFSSGILATGPDPPRGTAMYNYRPASDDVRATARRIEAICKRHGVPLVAAALQFPLGHPAVASVIPGGKSPAEVRSNVASMRRPIPGALWADLRAAGLLPPHIRAP